MNFETVVRKWAGFVESISSEKGLIFGPYIKSAKPLEIDGNKLKIYSGDIHFKEIIARQQEYIARKTEEHFGRKISFQFSHELPSGDAASFSQTSSTSEVEIGRDGDPYVNAILNELGGEEVL